MKKIDKESTRFYSTNHENSICKALNAQRQSNSGAGNFQKGDVVHKEADMLIEAKCSMSSKSSFSIKKDWLEKNKEESFYIRRSSNALCFNFEPEGNNYYVINEKLMKFLIEKLSEDNKNS